MLRAWKDEMYGIMASLLLRPRREFEEAYHRLVDCAEAYAAHAQIMDEMIYTSEEYHKASFIDYDLLDDLSEAAIALYRLQHR
jgi:hypothetical protein